MMIGTILAVAVLAVAAAWAGLVSFDVFGPELEPEWSEEWQARCIAAGGLAGIALAIWTLL